MDYLKRKLVSESMVNRLDGFDVEMICKLLSCNPDDIIDVEEEHIFTIGCYHEPIRRTYDANEYVSESDININLVELISVDIKIGDNVLNYGYCGKCHCGKVYWKRGVK